MGRAFNRGGMVVAALTAGVVMVSGGTAQAVVATAPLTNVPYLTGTDNYVYTADVAGTTTFIGGTITKVFAPNGSKTVTRSNLFGYTSTTGALTSFAPTFNGPVQALTHDSTYLYVGGHFSTVNGVTIHNLARFNLSTGALDATFKPSPSGQVQHLAYFRNQIIVGGSFTTIGGASRVALASLDPATAKATSLFNVPIAGTVSSTNAGATSVRSFAINPAGTRLVAIGNFTTVGGATHWRGFMLDIGASSVSVDAWAPPVLKVQCATIVPVYLFDVKFSPDGSYFVIAASGFGNSGPLTNTVCDAASKWWTSPASNTPVWVNWTGGDSLYAVEVTKDAVYVTGHERWLDNPYGRDYAGPGAVSRPGIGAIDPITGKALSWNPTRSRGKGGRVLMMTAQGLLVGSDCSPPPPPGTTTTDVSAGSNYFNFKFHPCLAVAPGA